VPARLVDLTLTLTHGLRTWETKPPVTILPYMSAATFKGGFTTKLLVIEDHTGTHVDASLHFYDGVRRTPKGHSISDLPLEKLFGDAVCLDVSAKRGGEPVTAELAVWWRVLVAFDVIFTALAMVLADTVLVG